jgi:predicted HTH domain antitoxin
MQKVIAINCPQEILLGLHLDEEQFAETVKLQAAIALFRDGKLTSGMAARWLNMPRVHFLLKAMQGGSVTLLQNNKDDFTRETSLL